MVRDPDHHYSYTFQQGKAKCETLGMQMATLDQIRKAFDQGYGICSCGWLSDGTAWFPLQEKNFPCGGDPVGIHRCNWQNTFNVFCYKT